MELPTKFEERMKELISEDYDNFQRKLQEDKSYALRLNTLKIENYLNNGYLKSIITEHTLARTGFYFHPNETPGRHPYHHAGVYYIQDPSAMMVIENADIKKHDIVLDMCAAPGGKSTHILSKLEHTGLLITNEINAKRAKILSLNIERMGARNAIVTNADPINLNKEFYGYFDKVIVDAPCSGEGMFRKDPNAICEWSEDNIYNCQNIQQSLLEEAYKLIKKDGLIIYSTCTFNLEENEKVINTFLNEHSDLTLLPTIKNNHIDDGIPINNNKQLKHCSRFYFHHFKGEGHFIAKIQKTSDTEHYKKTKSKSLKRANKAHLKTLDDFFKKYILDFNLTEQIYDFNNHLYLLNYNDVIPNLDHLKILRYGLHLGEIKKDRFEPSHALALSLKPNQVKHVIDFDSNSEEIIKYLSGEALPYPGNDHYTLITVDGFSIGWSKHVNNLLKNHYPKGLRIKK